MLKSIRIKGTFGHRDSFFEFKRGMTAITGLNGAGKSMIGEMIQFAYWGINALRGISSDYPELSVVLESWIKGKPYTIERTISKAVLYEGHGEDKVKKANGTKAVNQAIKELFGYSMAVFQVANAINQKEVDAFCKMLPTARKKLVDETIGLSALDDLHKWINENELATRAQIAARAELMTKPIEPVKPEGYIDSATASAAMASLAAQRAEFHALTQVANQIIADLPPVFLDPEDSKLEEYKAGGVAWAALMTEAGILGRDIAALGVVPESTGAKLEDDDANLEQYQNDRVQRSALDAGIKSLKSSGSSNMNFREPKWPADLVELEIGKHEMLKRWNARKLLMEKGVKYHCEKCAHDGLMVDPRVAEEFGDVPEAAPVPQLDMTELIVARSQHAHTAERAHHHTMIAENEAKLAAIPDNLVRIVAIQAARQAVEADKDAKTKQARAAELALKRTELGARMKDAGHWDTTAEVARILAARQAYLVWDTKNKARTAQVTLREEARTKLAAMPQTLDTQYDVLTKARDSAMLFETLKGQYDVALVKYEAVMLEQGHLQAKMDDWSNAKLAVTDLRTKIKGYLLPSLNRVASNLISDFSGGLFQYVTIDEDFEVIVDGQRVETLSGGGKTVANLAIRIGLGQVLTNKVFPVLMLDEPDESCDDERAKQIEQALGIIKTKMEQVILVTHKTGEHSDHRIHLERK